MHITIILIAMIGLLMGNIVTAERPSLSGDSYLQVDQISSDCPAVKFTPADCAVLEDYSMLSVMIVSDLGMVEVDYAEFVPQTSEGVERWLDLIPV